MMKVTVYLKNGRDFSFQTSHFEIKKTVTGEMASIGWNQSETGISLKYLDLSEVIAITTQKSEANSDEETDS